MQIHSQEFSIEKMAKIFTVSRCGYYEFLNRKPSKKAVEVALNYLDQRFMAERPNKVWISDITYVWTSRGMALCSFGSGSFL